MILPALSQLDTIHPYIKAASDGISTVASMAWEATFDGLICGRSTWLSRSIENLTHKYLPPATAKVASIVIQSAPFASAFLTLPFYPVLGMCVICSIGRSLAGPGQANPVKDYDTGFVLALEIAGITSVARGIINRDILEGCTGALVYGISCILYSQLGVREDFVNCIEELTGNQNH